MSFLHDLLAFRLASAAGLVLVPGTVFSLVIISYFNLNNLQYSNTLVQVLGYVFSLAVYNVYFHPLSGFPGPRLHSASIIPYMWDLLCGRSGFRLLELHKKYGEVVRIHPNELSYINIDAWKDIYASRVGHSQMQKDPAFYATPVESPSIFLSNDADHVRMRRLVSHAFSEKALRDQGPILQEYINLLMSRLHIVAKAGKQTDIVEWFNWTTFDLTGYLSFGESFGCLQNAASHPWVEIITDSVQASTFLSIAGRIPGLNGLLLKLMPKSAVEKMEWFVKMSSDLSDKRMAMKTDRQDFMTFIMKHNGEKGVSVPEIRATAMVLIVGGSETTASTLSAILWYLLQHTSIYRTFVQEIRGSLEKDEDITIHNLTHFKYLTAVINEGLRIYPPAPLGSPRLVPGKGDTILGKWIPGGVGFIFDACISYS
jgi:cytochrome P450